MRARGHGLPSRLRRKQKKILPHKYGVFMEEACFENHGTVMIFLSLSTRKVVEARQGVHVAQKWIEN
jgi:hypothetical protein